MIVIATNNGKSKLEKLLESLNQIGNEEEVVVVDTQSTEQESLKFINSLSENSEYRYKITTYQTPYRGFDTGAYIYAIKNLHSDRFYFLQDSMIIKSKDYFEKIDRKLEIGTVVSLLTFQSNFFANSEQINFCSSNFGTSHYNKGIFGPIFSIMYDDAKKIDRSLLVYSYNKMTQMAMERGWSVIFEKYNFNIESIEGEKDDDKLYGDKYTTFTKFFPYRT